jgi:hypothetical protein
MRSVPACEPVIRTARGPMRAADSLAVLGEPPEALIAQGRLTEIPGIGDTIADIATTMHRTGTHPHLEFLRQEIPSGVLEMPAIPGLRPGAPEHDPQAVLGFLEARDVEGDQLRSPERAGEAQQGQRAVPQASNPPGGAGAQLVGAVRPGLRVGG